jgi:hypothetical protein
MALRQNQMLYYVILHPTEARNRFNPDISNILGRCVKTSVTATHG